ncbi:MAG TPA: hypothetical protein VFC36_02950 [Paludibacter sp.]|nr:hypothetical protein [Paludibacter sp.]
MPKGYRDILASEHSVTPEYIDMIFRGTRENLAIVQTATQLAEEHRKEMNSLVMELKSASLNVMMIVCTKGMGLSIIQTMFLD